MRSLLRIVLAAAAALLFAALVRQPTLRKLPFEGKTRASEAMLRQHVAVLTATRDAEQKADWLERELRRTGARVEMQLFDARRKQHRNLIARFGPEHGPLLVIGAHYDTFGDLPGADDNASGTAAILELARLLTRTPPSTPVALVAYANEEPPYFGSEDMGSAVHASSLKNVAGMICLEMIGYFTEKQTWPNWTFAALYPSHGHFIGVGGGWSDRTLAKHVKRAIDGAGGIPVVTFTGPRTTLDASDQRNYWSRGWPAVLVTDTAFLRNPHYHTRNDTAETLDYERMARVVDGVLSAALHAGRVTS